MTWTKSAKLAFSGAVWFVSAQIGVCAEPAIPTERNPLPDVRSAQESRQSDTIASVKVALDKTESLKRRVDAISSLGGVKFDYLLANGEGLVASDAPIAKAVVTVIGSEIAMLPSSEGHAHGGEGDDQYTRYQNTLVERSEKLLRSALSHPDFDVRLEASNILTARGDPQAIVAIDTMIQKGELKAQAGIGYMSLAPADIASPFVEKYLTADNDESRAAAVAQLAYNPRYVEQVRGIALADGTPPNVVAAALPGLSASDPTFLEYGVAIANDESATVKEREAALAASANVLLSRQDSSPDFVKKLSSTLKQASTEVGTRTAIETIESLERGVRE
ncbi:hypothetical protein [Sinorhizobium medicae]|uniref:hypothetical protein n=1 Tax=Sinorhizobium medicae TaxID=110321 RepID=UPI000FD96273|nr:hypothetical protein [Sinorhizobium medicae]RVJ72541.1 hypothetical protein CN168_26740 [Sinorhizobium medicae]